MSKKTNTLIIHVCIVTAFISAGPACAEPGDDAAIAKARRDYEAAKQSNDIGLMNAMKITLDVQLAKARARAGKKESADSQAGPDAKKSTQKL